MAYFRPKKARRTQFSEGGGRAFPGISDHFFWFVWSSYGLKNIMRDIVKKNSDRTHLSPYPTAEFTLTHCQRISFPIINYQANHLSPQIMKIEDSIWSFLLYCETQPPASIGWVALSSVVRSLFVRPASVTSPLISTIWCFPAYKPYIFCEDMILATCQCQHIFCCWVEPSLLLSSFVSWFGFCVLEGV